MPLEGSDSPGQSGPPQASPEPHPEGAEFDARPWWMSPEAWLLFVAGLAADQLSKAAITANLVRGESWPAEGFFRFTYARNTGTIFGLLRDQGLLLTVVSFAALGAILIFFRESAFPSRLTRVALGMMVGGAIGNLLDRLRLGFVVDFIDVGPWPIFNLADSLILVGIGILVWSATGRPKVLDEAVEADSGEKPEVSPPARAEDDGEQG